MRAWITFICDALIALSCAYILGHGVGDGEIEVAAFIVLIANLVRMSVAVRQKGVNS